MTEDQKPIFKGNRHAINGFVRCPLSGAFLSPLPSTHALDAKLQEINESISRLEALEARLMKLESNEK